MNFDRGFISSKIGAKPAGNEATCPICHKTLPALSWYVRPAGTDDYYHENCYYRQYGLTTLPR